MRLLLDAHALLWWLAGDPQLGTRARDAVADDRNETLVSVAAIWEIAIKRAAGRLDAPRRIADAARDQGFETLDIGPDHAEAAAALPLHHRDPFDRMLVAQAEAVQGCVVTRDPRIAAYGVPTLW